MFFFLPTGVDRTITRTPWVTYGLLIANTAAYLVQHWVLPYTEKVSAGQIVQDYAFTVAAPTVLQAITHLFTHAGLLHLLPNMLYLYLVGVTVEDRIGPLRMVAIYFLGGFAGLGLHWWSVAGSEAAAIPLAGASGAIAALMGAFTVLMPWTDIKVSYAYMIMYRYSGSGVTLVPALLFLGLYFFVSDVIWGFVTLSSVRTPVAYWAHVGGFSFGALVSGCFYGFQALWTTEAELHRRERQIARSLQKSLRSSQTPEHLAQVVPRPVGDGEPPVSSASQSPTATVSPVSPLAPILPLASLSLSPSIEEAEGAGAGTTAEATATAPAPTPAAPGAPPRLLDIRSFTQTVTPEPTVRHAPSIGLLPPGTLHPTAVSSSVRPAGPPTLATMDISHQPAPFEPMDPALAKLGKELAEGELRHIVETPPLPGTRPERLPATPQAACTLMLLPAPHLALDRVVRTLITLLHSPADQVASRLRLRAGILYADVPYEDGALLRARLAEAGVPALLLENSPAVQPLEAVRPQRLEMTPTAWHWRTAEGWTETRPSDQAFVVAGRVRIAPADPLPASVLDLHYPALGKRMRLLRAAQPRVSEGAGGGDAAEGQQLWHVAAQLLSAAPTAQRAAALDLWIQSHGAPETLPLFKNVAVFDYYNYWHYLLWLAPSAKA